MRLTSGTRLGRYAVVAPLGADGMGEVYLARDESLDRSVALKILPPELVKNDERVRRFVQEAKSASSLSHPNIVTIYEIGEAYGVHFIAIEFVKGSTLKDLIHAKKTDLRTLNRRHHVRCDRGTRAAPSLPAPKAASGTAWAFKSLTCTGGNRDSMAP